MNWCVYWALNSLCRLVATLYFSTIYSVVIFTMSLFSFYVVLTRVITLSCRTFFARLNEAKFRLLQSDKQRQGVDREASR